jgi:hypothetical protein
MLPIEPGPGVIEEVVREVIDKTDFTKMGHLHGFYMPNDDRPLHDLRAEKTPVRGVILMK